MFGLCTSKSSVMISMMRLKVRSNRSECRYLIGTTLSEGRTTISRLSSTGAIRVIKAYAKGTFIPELQSFLSNPPDPEIEDIRPGVNGSYYDGKWVPAGQPIPAPAVPQRTFVGDMKNVWNSIKAGDLAPDKNTLDSFFTEGHPNSALVEGLLSYPGVSAGGKLPSVAKAIAGVAGGLGGAVITPAILDKILPADTPHRKALLSVSSIAGLAAGAKGTNKLQGWHSNELEKEALFKVAGPRESFALVKSKPLDFNDHDAIRKKVTSPPPKIYVNPTVEELNSTTWWHGGGTPDISPDTLTSTVQADSSLYGPGVYLADDWVSAPLTFARDRSSSKLAIPTIYEARVNMNNVLDMNAAITPESASAFIRAGVPKETVLDLRSKGLTNGSLWGTLAKDIGPRATNDNLAQTYDAFTHASYGNGGGNNPNPMQPSRNEYRALIVLKPEAEQAGKVTKFSGQAAQEVVTANTSATYGLSDSDRTRDLVDRTERDRNAMVYRDKLSGWLKNLSTVEDPSKREYELKKIITTHNYYVGQETAADKKMSEKLDLMYENLIKSNLYLNLTSNLGPIITEAQIVIKQLTQGSYPKTSAKSPEQIVNELKTLLNEGITAPPRLPVTRKINDEVSRSVWNVIHGLEAAAAHGSPEWYKIILRQNPQLGVGKNIFASMKPKNVVEKLLGRLNRAQSD